jgi:carbon-monoxide dehydrogenase medium subunit
VPLRIDAPSEDEDEVSAAVRKTSFDPPGDVHASAEYRRHLAAVLAARAVKQARERRS